MKCEGKTDPRPAVAENRIGRKKQIWSEIKASGLDILSLKCYIKHPGRKFGKPLNVNI